MNLLWTRSFFLFFPFKYDAVIIKQPSSCSFGKKKLLKILKILIILKNKNHRCLAPLTNFGKCWSFFGTRQRRIRYLFTKYDNPIFGRIIYIGPFWYVLFKLMDKFYLANKKLAEMLLMINVILIGIFIIRGNLKESSYSFNEYWMWYILYWKYIGYFFFLKWKKVILCLYIVMIANIITMNWFYSGIPFTFYSSTIIILILFPITLIFISQKNSRDDYFIEN